MSSENSYFFVPGRREKTFVFPEWQNQRLQTLVLNALGALPTVAFKSSFISYFAFLTVQDDFIFWRCCF